MVTRISALIAILALIGYGGIKAWPMIRGPFIELSSPLSYSTAPDGAVTLSGMATHTETLSLNGGLLLMDQEGRFLTTLLLPSGGAILSLTATDRFGRSTTVQRVVYIP
jgi:hypothetical protein